MSLIRYTSCLLAVTAAEFGYGQGILEASFERLDNDLFEIRLASAQATQSISDWTVQTSISRSEFDLDFIPAEFDFLGEPTPIDETTHSLGFKVSKELGEQRVIELSTAYRDGFPNYRSVWLDTYFDQHFSPLEGVTGHELYENFKASAASLGAGMRWEYLPASAFLSVYLTRIKDEVSPGYEIDFDGITRGQTSLITNALSLSTENVVTKRIRSLLSVSAVDTSEREIRYSGELAVNVSLNEAMVWRNRIGATREGSSFDANFYETTVELQLNRALAVYATGRSYQDSGEIENALLFTTAAPELTSDSVGIGLRLETESWQAKLFLSSTESDYAEGNPDLDFFQNLYRDSDWTLLQLSIGNRF
ncbi:hypothetical protein [Pelagicoccus albus]|uniref:Beta-barrel porin 2 n=1 Tax=Pelagicoccus albus TaxID=415222 RepID=A0A7X1B3A5_9BACT|nr:hypothetical protein [Pelagicoccus albus]MBC2604797.1 hypothetical protein [Pelagicoccus albus]